MPEKASERSAWEAAGPASCARVPAHLSGGVLDPCQDVRQSVAEVGFDLYDGLERLAVLGGQRGRRLPDDTGLAPQGGEGTGGLGPVSGDGAAAVGGPHDDHRERLVLLERLLGVDDPGGLGAARQEGGPVVGGASPSFPA
ncbi:hypothetical protein STENM223S_03436 [Streptomyces tendae]